MSRQPGPSQLNYYSRFSRGKRQNHSLNHSILTARSRFTLNSSGRSSHTSPNMHIVDDHSGQNQTGKKLPKKQKDHPLKIETGQQEKTQQNQVSPSRSRDGQGKTVAKDTNAQHFIEPSPSRFKHPFENKPQSIGLSGNVQESIPSLIEKYNLNISSSEYTSSQRLFQVESESISSIQQGESIYNGTRYKGSAAQDYSVTTSQQEQKKIFHRRQYSSSKESRRQKQSVTVKHNFKSLFKKKASQQPKHTRLEVSQTEIVEETQVISSPKFGGMPQIRRNYQNHQLEEGLSQSDQVPNNSHSLSYGSSQQNWVQQKISTENPIVSPDETQSQKNQDAHQKFYTITHRAADEREGRQTTPPSKDRQQSQQSGWTLEDRLQEAYRLNFSSPSSRKPKEQSSSKKKDASNSKDNAKNKKHSPESKPSPAAPKIVRFVEFFPPQKSFYNPKDLNSHSGTEMKKSGVDASTRGEKRSERVKQFTQSWSERQTYQRKQQKNQQLPQKYDHILGKLQELSNFVGNLSQAKRTSYTNLIKRLGSNVEAAKESFQRQKATLEKKCYDTQTKSTLVREKVQYQKHIKLIERVSDPQQLEILFNKIIIESIVSNLSEVVGSHFQLDSFDG